MTISSPGAGRVLPDYVVVGASKAAIESITRYLAVELASKNIVVNAVSPGMVTHRCATTLRDGAYRCAPG